MSFNKFIPSVSSTSSLLSSDCDSDVIKKNELRDLENSSNNDIDIKSIFDKLHNFELLIHEEKHKNHINIKNMENELNIIKNENKNLTDEVKHIYDQLYDIEIRLIDTEQYNRRQNLIITGIPESIKQNDLELTVIDILRSIGLQISSYEIVGCHRLYKPKNSKYAAKTIVRFINRKATEYCMFYRKRLAEVKSFIGMNLRFQENLCEANEHVLKWSRDLKKYDFIHEYYIRNGFIKIIVNKDDPPIKIHHPDDLYSRFNNFIDHTEIYKI